MVYVDKEHRVFHLHNESMSYILSILPDGSPGLLHFGPSVPVKGEYHKLAYWEGRGSSSHAEGLPEEYCLDFCFREYPSALRGDYRSAALGAITADGMPLALDLVYEDYSLQAGKPPISGLPSTYTENPEDAETLILRFRDATAGMEVTLFYTLFRDYPVLCRRAIIKNVGLESITLLRAFSSSIDLPDAPWDCIHFSGTWARERHPYRVPLMPGIHSIGSTRGQSSHQHNPAFILAGPDTNERAGEAYGFALVYSGNFLAEAERGSHGDTRILLGIHPEHFSWKLEPGCVFETPEAILAYTIDGLGTLSNTFHRFMGTHLIRGSWRNKRRPILLNNWEGTYFDFDEEKLLSMAKSAGELGVELFVLDDGWFGQRNDDTSSLGDWSVNLKKLPGGISSLAEKVERLGIKFGLWIEPEMVNPKSQLFAAHPDWALGPLGGKRTLARHQYVLDLSRPEVVEYLYDIFCSLFHSAPISYVKWDMNRNLTEPVSAALPPDRQGEFFHRYILGYYKLLSRLQAEFPELLFEGCASGGGRFDGGTLAYVPQIWASDDSDAIERLYIQWGTSFIYPVATIGAHVSAVPNHQVGRITPLGTRAGVAYFGAFGYELDPLNLTDTEREEIRSQIAFYKEWGALFQFGTFYRLIGPQDRDGNEISWMSVSQDKKKAAVLRVQILAKPNPPAGRLRLRGLDPDRIYDVSVRPSTPVKDEASIRLNSGQRTGEELMAIGLLLGGDGWRGIPRGDYASWLYLFQA